MRISQLKSLDEHELNLLLYVFSVLDPIKPPLKVDSNLFLFIKPEILSWKVAQHESKLTPEGKIAFKGLMTKLNKTIAQEIIENLEYVDNSQLEFSLDYNIPTEAKSTQLELSL